MKGSNKMAPLHQRYARVVEVGFALALLVIWPCKSDDYGKDHC